MKRVRDREIIHDRHVDTKGKDGSTYSRIRDGQAEKKDRKKMTRNRRGERTTRKCVLFSFFLTSASLTHKATEKRITSVLKEHSWTSVKNTHRCNLRGSKKAFGSFF